MNGYNADDARQFILFHLNPKTRKAYKGDISRLIADFITYDLHFMRLTGVIDEAGEQGENEYDDDEAIEYIYGAWLDDHPNEDDNQMTVAAVLNEYMDLQYEYLLQNGLVSE